MPPTYPTEEVKEEEHVQPSLQELQEGVRLVYKALESFKQAQDLEADGLLTAGFSPIDETTPTFTKLHKIRNKLKGDPEWTEIRCKPLTRFLRTCGAVDVPSVEMVASASSDPQPTIQASASNIAFLAEDKKTKAEKLEEEAGDAWDWKQEKKKDKKEEWSFRDKERKGEFRENGRKLAGIGELPEIRKTLRELRAMGPRRTMFTGDTAKAGENDMAGDVSTNDGKSSESLGSRGQISETLAARRKALTNTPIQPKDRTPLDLLTEGCSESSKQALADIDKALDWLLFPGLIDDHLLVKHRKRARAGLLLRAASNLGGGMASITTAMSKGTTPMTKALSAGKKGS